MKAQLINLINKLGFMRGFSQRRVSFSQSGEDLIVRYIFNLLEIKNPGYLDIGANHPYLLNNTMKFYLEGSQGINIEPNPMLFQELEASRKNDINLKMGLTDQEGSADFYIMEDPNLSTFSKTEADSLVAMNYSRIQKMEKVSTQTLENIIKNYSGNKFPDFLTLDTEGMDEKILSSIDFQKNYPKVICVETITYSQHGKGEKRTAIIDQLKKNGYFLYADTYINSIFVHQKTWDDHFRNKP